MKTAILFVDDEEMLLKGFRRILAPRRTEWDMDFVLSGEDALAALKAKRYHVIVTDLLMPGMSGHALLKEAQRLYPEIKRIVLTGQPDREYDKEIIFPAHQYLMKPCDYQTLARVIDDLLFVDSIVMDAGTKELLSRIETLPALPKIYAQIIEELESDNPSTETLGELIRQDMGLVSKLITLVNSPFYGCHRKITDIQYAVVYFGIDMLRTLVLTCQAFSLYDSKKLPGFSLSLLWEHSMRTACLSKRIAISAGRGERETDNAFLAGMLHDVGKLVLATNFSKEYGEILAKVRKENLTIHAVEREMLGSTHAEVGAYLMGLWGVKPDLVKAIALHHSPELVSLASTPLLEVYAGNIMDHTNTVIHPDYAQWDEDFAKVNDNALARMIMQWEKDAVEYLKEQCA